ncbi:MAG: DUF4238 domain-containing protein, partial [Bradyrhizobium sp.]|nr:DUF4238 domain-containing protein [Bradyrhizobium sp.]
KLNSRFAKERTPMVARRHHFLPQCYLRGFSRSKKRGKTHQVVTFDRSGKSFTSNILNIAVEQDFNRVEIEGHAPDAFEQIMATFEGQLAPAITRVLQAQNIRNSEDRAILLNFIGLIAIRNPRFRESFRDFNEQIMDRVMDLATATPDRWEGQLKRMRENGYLKEGSANVTYEQMRDLVERKAHRIELNNTFNISSELKGFDAILPTLFNRKWVSLTPPSDSSGFITSDHPVCLMFSDPSMRGGVIGPGHGLRGTEIIFPVGKRLALVGAFELEEDEIQLTEENVAGVNGAIVAYAERQVYAHDTGFTYSRSYTEKPRRGADLVNDLLFRRKK